MPLGKALNHTAPQVQGMLPSAPGVCSLLLTVCVWSQKCTFFFFLDLHSLRHTNTLIYTIMTSLTLCLTITSISEVNTRSAALVWPTYTLKRRVPVIWPLWLPTRSAVLFLPTCSTARRSKDRQVIRQGHCYWHIMIARWRFLHEANRLLTRSTRVRPMYHSFQC